MTPGEQGFLLLASHLGDPERKCLTPAQFRELSRRVTTAEPCQELRQLEQKDLIALGYSRQDAQRILFLLEQEDVLDGYLKQAKKLGCHVLTRLSPSYPQSLRNKLGPDAPVCLWYKGDLSILAQKSISVVGNRIVRPESEVFSAEAGRQAALQGFAVVSGNARGTDRIAQRACLESGGQIIRILADCLSEHRETHRVLSVSEDSFDLPFSSHRALSRNRIIHALSPAVLVAQCDETRGGTWDGTQRNLRSGWSNVWCLQDQTDGIQELLRMGGQPLNLSDLSDLSALCQHGPNLFAY